MNIKNLLIFICFFNCLTIFDFERIDGGNFLATLLAKHRELTGEDYSDSRFLISLLNTIKSNPDGIHFFDVIPNEIKDSSFGLQIKNNYNSKFRHHREKPDAYNIQFYNQVNGSYFLDYRKILKSKLDDEVKKVVKSFFNSIMKKLFENKPIDNFVITSYKYISNKPGGKKTHFEILFEIFQKILKEFFEIDKGKIFNLNDQYELEIANMVSIELKERLSYSFNHFLYDSYLDCIRDVTTVDNKDDVTTVDNKDDVTTVDNKDDVTTANFSITPELRNLIVELDDYVQYFEVLPRLTDSMKENLCRVSNGLLDVETSFENFVRAALWALDGWVTMIIESQSDFLKSL